MDIYSLGIVIYWLVAGEGPYAGLPPYQVRHGLPSGALVWHPHARLGCKGQVEDSWSSQPPHGCLFAVCQSRRSAGCQHAFLPPLPPSQPQVVGKKLAEAHRKERLALPDSMPPVLKRLVWDCTHSDPQER